MLSAVKTKEAYDYTALKKSLNVIGARYPFCTVYSAGKSVLGRELYVLKIGEGKTSVFYNGAHHGAEWITSALLMKFAEDYCESYVSGKNIGQISSSALYKSTTLYILPMVNPDGVDISVNGARKYSGDFPELFKKNHNSSNFKKWQANFNGVDLNHNYDALWERAKEEERNLGINAPGPTRFGGEYPFSEPETRCLKKLTEENNFSLVAAFHSQGREIYYDFNNKEPSFAKKWATALTFGTVYLAAKPEKIASCGGYKDWFIDKFGKLGFTVEVGKGENPLPISDLKQIYKETLPILTGGMKLAYIAYLNE